MNKQWKIGLALLALGTLIPSAYAVEKPATSTVSKPTANNTAMVNVNTATLSQLTTVKGLGLKKAQAILDYRQQSGPFKKLEDLTQVPGISDKLLAKIKPHLTL